ncbi:STAS domain-containing protein [Amycolatopsis thermoflava]
MVSSGPEEVGDSEPVVVVEPRQDATVVHVAGELDMLTAPQVEAAVLREVRSAADVIVLDLSRVTFLGLQGLSIIVVAQEEAGDTEVRVVASTPVTLRPLQLTQIDRLVDVYGSLAEALAPATPQPGEPGRSVRQ